MQPAIVTEVPSPARPWYLRASRPDGSAHSWAPFHTWGGLLRLVDVWVPHLPQDSVYAVTANTYAPEDPWGR